MHPLKIGVTGGIGSGKSLICRVFMELGVPVYEADREAKKMLSGNPGITEQIKKEFGDNIYDAQNNIQSKKLSEIVFNDVLKLKKLNAIIHPAVKQDFLNWLKNTGNVPYIIKEAAIMFESGSHKELDKIITVYSPENLRIQRIQQRDKVSEEKIRARMKHQIPEEEKLKKSDFVIYNDGDSLVLPQILSLHNQFLKESSGGS